MWPRAPSAWFLAPSAATDLASAATCPHFTDAASLTPRATRWKLVDRPPAGNYSPACAVARGFRTGEGQSAFAGCLPWTSGETVGLITAGAWLTGETVGLVRTAKDAVLARDLMAGSGLCGFRRSLIVRDKKVEGCRDNNKLEYG